MHWIGVSRRLSDWQGLLTVDKGSMCQKVYRARRLLVWREKAAGQSGVDPLYRRTKTAMGCLMLSKALSLTLTLARALFGEKVYGARRLLVYGARRLLVYGARRLLSIAREGYWSIFFIFFRKFQSLR